ncbi:armadillo repeat-containing protein 7 isoform X4 [Gossypium hirsutum]|uniref:Armadillo repeat-containing protein 7 isoform X4 n=1 Tax=Gossypium hirsutum TaxID=3635 RepID=A0ABM3C2U6_GOSHI|nr:armadillo repeat-containing protein 7 isoform X4 [Gossypium hirsutum]XP_040973632.1 armadillo repeat-containing protein 7 isoform X4 [Gossypium hirsutum]
MFTNYQRQQERTGQYGTSRQQYLQELVNQFQNTSDEDCITEPNEKLMEFGIGGICNSCVDPANAAIITQCGGIPLVIKCLSSPVRNTVNYALGALYYLCNKSNREEILKPEVIDVIERYAAAQTVNASFSNLAKAFLDKHVS